MSRGKILLIFIIGFLVSPFINGLLPAGVNVDITLCLTIILMLTAEEESFAMVAGTGLTLALLGDLAHSRFLGPSAIVLIAIICLLIFFRRRMNVENPLLMAFLIGGAIIVHDVLEWGIYRILGVPFGFGYMLTGLAGSALPNMVICFAFILISIRKKASIRRAGYLSGYFK